MLFATSEKKVDFADTPIVRGPLWPRISDGANQESQRSSPKSLRSLDSWTNRLWTRTRVCPPKEKSGGYVHVSIETQVRSAYYAENQRALPRNHLILRIWPFAVCAQGYESFD